MANRIKAVALALLLHHDSGRDGPLRQPGGRGAGARLWPPADRGGWRSAGHGRRRRFQDKVQHIPGGEVAWRTGLRPLLWLSSWWWPLRRNPDRKSTRLNSSHLG